MLNANTTLKQNKQTKYLITLKANKISLSNKHMYLQPLRN